MAATPSGTAHGSGNRPRTAHPRVGPLCPAPFKRGFFCDPLADGLAKAQISIRPRAAIGGALIDPAGATFPWAKVERTRRLRRTPVHADAACFCAGPPAARRHRSLWSWSRVMVVVARGDRLAAAGAI